tara:strand:- start:1115 stop:1780 length:666 start_codon:yes stop_codon:yes gene_type:complete
MEEQDSLRRAAELSRMDRLEASEKLHQAKQDSLYILTSIKLDEAVRGRIQSEESTKKELLNLIKLQIKGEESGLNISDLSDDAQTDLFSKSPSMGQRGLSGQTWLMILTLVLLMVILLVIIMRNKQPVYLKPKAPVDNGSNNINDRVGSTEPKAFTQTQANENEEVRKSELQSLRQSAVSMSVSEKAGANQIVQDWLDDGNSNGDSETQTTDNQSEQEKNK